MSVFQWIESHKDLMNVTGAESALAETIRRELDPEAKCSKIDDMGCLYVSGKKNGVVFTAMMDVPGYLLLQQYPEKSVLISTLVTPPDRVAAFTATDSRGTSLKVRRDKDSDLYSIRKRGYKIGSVFKEKEGITETNGVLQGENLTRYALLYVLSRLAEEGRSCLFAAQGYGRAFAEYNFAMREKAKEIVFLGAVESEKSDPIVLVRNGKDFSDPDLVKKAEKAGFTPILSEIAVTKSQQCADAGAKVVTLALPYQDAGKGKRELSDSDVERFLKMAMKIQ